MLQQTSPATKKSNIPLWEWGMVFGFAACVDAALWFLDNVLVIGLGLSWLADFLMGLTLQFYFWFRGVRPTIARTLFQAGMTGLETVGDGELPFWWMDVAVMFVLDRADGKINEVVGTIPGGSAVANIAESETRRAA